MPPAGRNRGPDELRVKPIDGEDALTVFRVVTCADRGAPEFLDCLRSSRARGLEARDGTPEERFMIIRSGVSCFDTARRAALVGDRYNNLGGYVAELRLAPGEGFSFATWGSRGHLTVCGEAVKLRNAVVDILVIREVSEIADAVQVHDHRQRRKRSRCVRH